MFVGFFIATLWVVALGPIYNEGGDKAIQDKGFKPAVHQALSEADVSKLHGNFGND